MITLLDKTAENEEVLFRLTRHILFYVYMSMSILKKKKKKNNKNIF